ncbi:hypothetical protein [Streptomyces sp. TS71-3]|uniref:hypothetical protein n=1 Tax=Streptomyces sp. TS71-3 TaxID=2733862 RepID=UPI001BB36D40|nr:hypothetical protein [Streptomyces sp. TS71-3]
MGGIVIWVVTCAMLAVARVVKNLPKDSFSKFFDYRTSKYRIIASDTKERVATVQRQRLLFLGFVCVCATVVVLVLVSAGRNAEPSAPPSVSATVTPSPSARWPAHSAIEGA